VQFAATYHKEADLTLAVEREVVSTRRLSKSAMIIVLN